MGKYENNNFHCYVEVKFVEVKSSLLKPTMFQTKLNLRLTSTVLQNLWSKA